MYQDNKTADASKPSARTYGGDIISVFSSNVFSLVANLAIVVILTRLLGPKGYGLYNAILVIPLLVVSFFQMGIRPSTVFMIGSGKYDQDQVVSAVLSALILTGGSGILFSLTTYLFMYRDGYTPLLIGMALLTIPMRLSAIYAGGVFLAKEQMGKANLMNWLTALLMLVSALFFVWILKLKVAGALFGMLISNLFVSVYAIRMLYKSYNVKISLKNPLILSMLKLGVVYAISFLIIQLNYRIDIILLQRLADTREVGLYSLGVAMAELLWQIPLAISIVVMTRSANSKDPELMTSNTLRLLRLSLVAGVVLSVFIFVLAPFVIPMVFGESFRESIGIVQSILPAIIIVIIFRILSGQLSGMGRPEVAIYSFLPALILNIILNFILIPGLGGLGAAISSNVSYLTGSLIYLYRYTKITGTSISEIFRFSVGDFIFVKNFIKHMLNRFK